MTTNDVFEPVGPSAYVTGENRAGTKNVSGSATDFTYAARGLLAVPQNPVIASKDGKSVVWNSASFEFLEDLENVPPMVSAPVWRQGVLLQRAGLFQVASQRAGAVYQVRGFDLANMTIVTGSTGLVVIDPLGSSETAQAALQLYRFATEDQKPVSAVVHTQSGVDHFGGVRGLFGAKVPANLPVYAPDRLLADALLNQVTNGAQSAKLLDYAYGTRLEPGPSGLVESDLGLTLYVGTSTFVAPTHTVGGLLPAATSQADWPASTQIAWHEGLYVVEVDGVELVLQPLSGHAASPEMNVYLPAFNTVYLAGPGPLGGVNKARAAFLDQTIAAFGATARIGMSAYGWPVWTTVGEDMTTPGNEVSAWLSAHRAAATTADPGALASVVNSSGYAGTPTRTVRELWAKLAGTSLGAPDLAVTAKAALIAQGGAAKLIAAAQNAYDKTTPDYAQAVVLLDPVISACSIPLAVPANTEKQARTLQSHALTQLAYLSTNGRLRNACLTAAHDVLNPGSIVTRFPQTITDLAAAANPLS